MSEKSLSVGTLNTVYGTNGHRLFEFLLTHGLHLSRRDHLIRLFNRTAIASDFVDEVELRLNGSLDIVALAEVLGKTQRLQLIEVLKGKGYDHFHYGQGKSLSDGEYDETLIASRPEIQLINLQEIKPDQTGQHGNGGGLAAVHLPNYSCNLYTGHFPLRPHSFREQVNIMTEGRGTGKSTYGDVRHEILLGDFNMNPEKLQDEYEELIKGLKLISPNELTCNTTRFLGSFLSRFFPHLVGCFDQIYVSQDVQVLESELVPAQSDHHGVYAHLKLTV